MTFATWSLVIGLAAAVAAYLLKDLFVDESDVKNPYRNLVRGVGWAGVIAALYGLALIVLGVA